MSILISMMKGNVSNLFVIELVFKCPQIIFSGHWIFTYLSPPFASKVSLCSVLSNEFRIILLWVMKLSLSQSTDSLLSEVPLFVFFGEMLCLKNNSYLKKKLFNNSYFSRIVQMQTVLSKIIRCYVTTFYKIVAIFTQSNLKAFFLATWTEYVFNSINVTLTSNIHNAVCYNFDIRTPL